MKKRVLYLTLAAGIVVWCLGAVQARASTIFTLPPSVTLDHLVGANFGNSVQVQEAGAPTGKFDLFTDFTFSASVLAGTPPVLTAAGVTVAAFTPPLSNESGISFSGAFFAPVGSIVDYAISYTVTAPAGFKFSDALLSGSLSAGGRDGSIIISESLGTGLPTLVVNNPPSSSDSVTFPGVTTIQVQKDILLNGGTAGTGAAATIINQGFSSTPGVPEPTSMALLGIGMTGFLAFRRLFKRTSVA
jgi:hypothetical protein